MTRSQRRTAAGTVATLALTLTLGQAAQAETREWRIDTVNGSPAQGEAGLRLSDEGALSGKTGCNGFMGTAFFADGLLLVDEPLATTRMACPGAEVTAQEDAVLRVLSGAVAVAFNPVSGAMTLTKEGDSMMLVPGAFDAAAAQNPPEPAVFEADYVNVFGLSGPLNIRSTASTDAKVVTRVLAGTLLRNEGCEHGTDRDWCRIAFLDASGREGWAAAEYLQSAPALVRAKDGVFDRIGTVECQTAGEDAPGTCDYGLAHDGAHSAALVVYTPDGGTLLFSFTDGTFVDAFQDGRMIAGVDSVDEGETVALSVAGSRFDVPKAIIRPDAQ
ncbi:META domain-containing protein [Roseovarius aestuariivivens]|uniref:META domain-containing protein n=1 Tax=Roseovarius aestuariivivens TaxID=1888910 RepID=UPI0010807570|nr:META domain-containing protein [Roseovarius aestuariivivens]